MIKVPSENRTSPVRGPGLIRRLAVIIYDGLLLAGVVFACWAILWVFLLGVPDSIESHPLFTLLKRCYLLAISFVFYGWFWVNGGQTLGMRAWRLGLVTTSGKPVTWRDAGVRYLGAILSWGFAAMGFMWVLVNRKNRTWHGMLSGTRIIMLPGTGKDNKAHTH